MMAMVGLVIDGGGTFAQRREQQTGADLAALAGANTYMNTAGAPAIKRAAAIAAARAVPFEEIAETTTETAEKFFRFNRK